LGEIAKAVPRSVREWRSAETPFCFWFEWFMVRGGQSVVGPPVAESSDPADIHLAEARSSEE
jgi:hypothetical protein